jgi:phospholipid/cholesterol/gamma-HCH transport system substrate-binding protein
MKPKATNFLVGLTTLAGLAGLAFLLMMFGYVSVWSEKGFRITVILNSASGLNTGSRVRFSGIDVGRVVDISLHNPSGSEPGVKVVAMIEEKYAQQIPYDVGASVEAPLIGGSPSIGLKVPKHLPAETSPSTSAADTAPAHGQWLSQRSPEDPIQGVQADLVSQFTAEIRAALKEPIKDLHNASEAFTQLSGEWTSVGANIKEMTAQRTLDDVNKDPAKANLYTISLRVDQRVKEIERVIDGLDKWVNDKKLREDITQTAAKARSVMEKLDKGADEFNGLTKDTRVQVNALALKYIATADELSSALNSAKKLIDTARAGEGTTGKLINDPALYNNLNDSVKRIEAAMADIQLLVRKWKDEGVPIQF